MKHRPTGTPAHDHAEPFALNPGNGTRCYHHTVADSSVYFELPQPPSLESPASVRPLRIRGDRWASGKIRGYLRHGLPDVSQPKTP